VSKKVCSRVAGTADPITARYDAISEISITFDLPVALPGDRAGNVSLTVYPS